MTDSPDARELVITRIFDAPRELVYRAFIDPDHLARWFAPTGFSVPRDSVDVDARPGGHQRLDMVSDDDPSVRSPVDARFLEVIENELLVSVEEWEGVPGVQPATRIYLRLEFHDQGGKTRLVLRQGPYTEAMEEPARAGWNSSLDQLDALLAP